MRKKYIREVKSALMQTVSLPEDLLTEKDLEPLPELVRNYIRFTGFVGKPKPKSVFVRASGRMRSKPGSWMKFASEQYNVFENPVRAFFIKARKMGIPANGLHLYRDCKASMVIKILGLFRIVDARGPEMDQGETVTVLNDMCFMAPGTLTDKKIKWETIDSRHIKAIFSNGNIVVSATLTFDEEGRLVDFISHDRFETADGKTYNNYPWRTPVRKYGIFNGYNLPAKADVIYLRPEGEFCYMEFTAGAIEYNRTNL